MKSISDLIAGGVSEALLREHTRKIAQEREQVVRDEEIRERVYREKNNLIKLDNWANCQRGVPNSVLRSSLFSVIQPKDVWQCEDLILHESETLTIKYTGKRLTQADLDVWECALHLSRSQNLGNKIEITEYAFLKELDRKTTKQEYSWLRKILRNLIACCVEIKHQGLVFNGSLIHNVYREESTGRTMMSINPEIARLFEGGATWINWEERQCIGRRRPLAQWLHGYISSHAKWYPHKVATLRDYSGSETKEEREFKRALKNALGHLLSLNLIKSYRIDDKNLVHIDRPPSRSQQKKRDSKAD